jgi:hypothetical protein
MDRCAFLGYPAYLIGEPLKRRHGTSRREPHLPLADSIDDQRKNGDENEPQPCELRDHLLTPDIVDCVRRVCF